jgi:hypothetical protein
LFTRIPTRPTCRPPLANESRHAFSAHQIHVGEQHVCALLGEEQGDRFADFCGRPGHDGYSVPQRMGTSPTDATGWQQKKFSTIQRSEQGKSKARSYWDPRAGIVLK